MEKGNNVQKSVNEEDALLCHMAKERDKNALESGFVDIEKLINR